MGREISFKSYCCHTILNACVRVYVPAFVAISSYLIYWGWQNHISATQRNSRCRCPPPSASSRVCIYGTEKQQCLIITLTLRQPKQACLVYISQALSYWSDGTHFIWEGNELPGRQHHSAVSVQAGREIQTLRKEGGGGEVNQKRQTKRDAQPGPVLA